MRLGEALPVYLQGRVFNKAHEYHKRTSKVSVPPPILSKFCPELSIWASSEPALALRFQRSPNPSGNPSPELCTKGAQTPSCSFTLQNRKEVIQVFLECGIQDNNIKQQKRPWNATNGQGSGQGSKERQSALPCTFHHRSKERASQEEALS